MYCINLHDLSKFHYSCVFLRGVFVCLDAVSDICPLYCFALREVTAGL